MSEHTPGPWFCSDGDAPGFKTRSGGESVLANARPSDDYFILKIAEMDSNVPAHERAANARLIAAAPELLEALRQARNQVVAFALDTLPADRAEAQVAYIDEAISKATIPQHKAKEKE